MRKFITVAFLAVAAQMILSSSIALAVKDGSDVPACAGVTDVCMKAGYEPGEHKKDGKGLWMDCVVPVAHGKTVAGVTGITQAAAHACGQAERAAHPKK